MSTSKSQTETSDKLLTELKRQEKYLKKLPSGFSFPLFNSKQAIESQRRSGYHNTASAAREIVDNAIESGASDIRITFDRAKTGNGKEVVSSIAFIDNGPGMVKTMAQYALSWGGGTHFDEPNFIGKFGFGLPNASINQTRKVEVYTRTSPSDRIRMASLDIDEYSEHGIQTIKPEREAELPAFIKKYLKSENIKFDHGTVVVWVNPDRLTYKTPATLKEHLVDDFGVTYRYLLGNQHQIKVETVTIDKVDPLFLDPEGRLFLRESGGGAILENEYFLDVQYVQELSTGATSLHLKSPNEDLKKGEQILAEGNVHLRIARFPVGFTEFAGHNKKAETDAHKRFEIRKPRRGMSFVRASREIETVDAFPRSIRDVSNDLGRWPLLQGYAYHWGVEVRFHPELDDVFGITNDKQKVRPIEDFWKLLAKQEVDAALRRENTWQQKSRKDAKPPSPSPTDEPTVAERAATFADSLTGAKDKIPAIALQGAEDNFNQKVKETSEKESIPEKEARAKVEKQIKKAKYKVEFFSDKYAPFYEPERRKTQCIVRINTAHPFYTVFYGTLYKLAGGKRAKESVDLLLITLAKGELDIEDEAILAWQTDLRKNVWSRFLENGLKIVEQDIDPGIEEEEVNNQD